jgi:hypothetical protein
MTNGPVCHIAPVQPNPGPSPISIPSIPPAKPTIASLTQTVNAMRQVIMILSGQQGTQGRPGAPGQQGASSNSAKGTWSEVSRNSSTVRIFQNNDTNSDNWVDVEQINSLGMENRSTGQMWNWRR